MTINCGVCFMFHDGVIVTDIYYWWFNTPKYLQPPVTANFEAELEVRIIQLLLRDSNASVYEI